jgi:hypothetical protein
VTGTQEALLGTGQVSHVFTTWVGRTVASPGQRLGHSLLCQLPYCLLAPFVEGLCSLPLGSCLDKL